MGNVVCEDCGSRNIAEDKGGNHICTQCGSLNIKEDLLQQNLQEGEYGSITHMEDDNDFLDNGDDEENLQRRANKYMDRARRNYINQNDENAMQDVDKALEIDSKNPKALALKAKLCASIITPDNPSLANAIGYGKKAIENSQESDKISLANDLLAEISKQVIIMITFYFSRPSMIGSFEDAKKIHAIFYSWFKVFELPYVTKEKCYEIINMLKEIESKSGKGSVAEIINLAKTMVNGDVKYSSSFRQRVNYIFSDDYRPGKDEQYCYIATCIYDSYDCPQLWTLRRFRDLYLAKSFFGRLFIKIYYKLGSALVRRFGENTQFRIFWKKLLDNFVIYLNKTGYENREYWD